MKAGDVFGRLTVIEVKKYGRVDVECECGVKKEVAKRNLEYGSTRSCGCLQREVSRANIPAVRAARKQEAAK